jgi:predicted lipid-binding transport protein (Tim44 family)
LRLFDAFGLDAVALSLPGFLLIAVFLGTAQPKNKASETKQIAVDIPKAPEDFDDSFVKEPAAPDAKAPGGLAAAIAKARQVKQEPLKTSIPLAKERTGVQKI